MNDKEMNRIYYYYYYYYYYYNKNFDFLKNKDNKTKIRKYVMGKCLRHTK